MPQDHLCVSIACHIVIPGGLLDHGGRSWFERLDLVRARVRVHGPVLADPVVRIGAYFCPYIPFCSRSIHLSLHLACDVPSSHAVPACTLILIYFGQPGNFLSADILPRVQGLDLASSFSFQVGNTSASTTRMCH